MGDGITVTVVSGDGNKIVATVAVAADAALGRRDVRVGESTLADAVAIYDQIDRVEVTPNYAVSRLGGGGGTLHPVSAQFEAVAFANGPDGKPGTKDDYRISVVSASWDIAPSDPIAEEMKDHLFAGKITPKGRFLPAPAGPNPERVFGTSNAGDLKVIATVTEGDRTITGEGRLIVTAQRWNNPPIY
jgi:quinohemoprotein amine dehydrogenase